MSYSARIAIDFDNTIVAYDELFVAEARARELVPAAFIGDKRAVRTLVRALPGGEVHWQTLQAIVYGERIAGARPFPGAREFVARARAGGAYVAIVSHKSERAAAHRNGVDLRAGARRWLQANGFIGPAHVDAADVHFEPTRAAKLARIAAIGADVVIDDLLEVLTDPAFPPGVRRWLFAPDGAAGGPSIRTFANWEAMCAALT